MVKIRTGVAVAVLALSSTLACAQQGYVGVSGGESDSNVSGDQKEGAFKLYAGYDFNRTWGMEGGWAYLGEPGYTQGAGEQTAWFLAGKGMLPFNDKFHVFAKLGATHNRVDLGGDKSRNEWLAGVGAEYALNKKVGLRLEYEGFNKFGGEGGIQEPRVYAWSVGVTFRSF